MKYILTGLILAISPLFLLAHNPLSARYHLEVGEKVSLLTVNLSQDGVNQVFTEKYDEAYLNNLNRKEWKEMIVDYIKSNFNLSVGGEEIKLKEGGIKLGSHQTDLKFVLPPFASKSDSFEIYIPAFRENDNHQTIFSYSLNDEASHIILRKENSYQSMIVINSTSDSISGIPWVWFGLIGLIVLFIGIFLKQKFTTKKTQTLTLDYNRVS